MKKRMSVVLLAIIALMLLVTACSSGTTTPTTSPSNNATTLDGATLLQERCTVCHTLSRVESKKLSSAEWEAIVDRMISKGAKLSVDEKPLVVDYLAATYGQ